MRHPSNEDRRHLDQWSGEHVRDYERPGTIHNIGSAEHELQPVRQAVQARMPGRDVQRIGVDVQADGSRYAHDQRFVPAMPVWPPNPKKPSWY